MRIIRGTLTACIGALLLPLAAAAEDTIWTRIGDGMRLQATEQRPEIQRYARQYARYPKQLRSWLGRSEPYLWHIVAAVEARGMPMEVALLPAIESGFNPAARSPHDATGLWQFVPATARKFGLRSSEWYDGRRDPLSSTRAALDYLMYLQDQFDNWLLALAAYNVGENRISAEIRGARTRDFWKLSLPQETASHVPRLLALAAVVRNPSAYGVTLPRIADVPAAEVVELPGQAELSVAAAWTGLSLEELRRYNPALTAATTDPQGPHRLMLPPVAAEKLRGYFVAAGLKPHTAAGEHRIQPGESLSTIARHYGIATAELKRINGMDRETVRVGATLRVPAIRPARAPARSAPALQRKEHMIAAGDTLDHIARLYGVTVEQLGTWNNLAGDGLLSIGRRLVIWLPRESATLVSHP